MNRKDNLILAKIQRPKSNDSQLARMRIEFWPHNPTMDDGTSSSLGRERWISLRSGESRYLKQVIPDGVGKVYLRVDHSIDPRYLLEINDPQDVTVYAEQKR